MPNLTSGVSPSEIESRREGGMRVRGMRGFDHCRTGKSADAVLPTSYIPLGIVIPLDICK